MLHSRPMQQKHGHITAECKLLCQVPSPEAHMHSILMAHPPRRQHKNSMSSMRRRMDQRIKLDLHLIRPWLTSQQPLLPFSFHLISTSIHSEGDPLSHHHHVLCQIPLLLPLLLTAQNLHHLPPFLHRSTLILLSNVMVTFP